MLSAKYNEWDGFRAAMIAVPGMLRELLIFLSLFSLPVFAVDHYVTPPGGYGTNNPPYTNWADAATNIQWAVNAATNGETIWVTNGIYALTNQIVITNRMTLRSMNGYSNTVVFGNGLNRCFYLNGNYATVIGLSITNGLAASNDYWGRGAGIYASGVGCTVSNCLITGNSSYSTNRGEGGGGMYIQSGTAIVSIVRGNFSRTEGGGMLVQKGLFTNCIIESNIASNRGGGIYGSDITCFGCRIVSNKAYVVPDTYQGGGGVICVGGVSMFSNCVFSGNWTAYGGGGIYFPQTWGMVVDCVFSNNRAAAGGGLCLYASSSASATSVNCNIIGNHSDSDGGGVYIYDGGYVYNCVIKNNDAGRNGGGIRFENIQRRGGYVSCCTIASNYAGSYGGAVLFYTTNCNDSIYNCIIWSNNSPSASFREIYDVVTPTNLNAFWNTCANYTNFPPGQGNVTNDPLFVDYTGGNYRLNANSPCLNAGTNQTWMTNAFDIDGRQRIRYGIVDMGAYEAIYDGTIYRMGF